MHSLLGSLPKCQQELDMLIVGTDPKTYICRYNLLQDAQAHAGFVNSGIAAVLAGLRD